MVYLGFGTIWAFRHPWGSWDVSLVHKGGALCLCLCESPIKQSFVRELSEQFLKILFFFFFHVQLSSDMILLTSSLTGDFFEVGGTPQPDDRGRNVFPLIMIWIWREQLRRYFHFDSNSKPFYSYAFQPAYIPAEAPMKPYVRALKRPLKREYVKS